VAPLSPTPPISSAVKIPENTEEDVMTLNQHEGDIKMEYSSD
jgi:hypothetical protein